MMVEHDLFYDRKRKEVMMSSMDASIKVDGEKRHIHGEDIPDLSVKVCQMMFITQHSNPLYKCTSALYLTYSYTLLCKQISNHYL